VAAKDIPFDWWKLFQSPQLNALIERTLKNSPTIEAAQAALKQAHENVVAQQGSSTRLSVSTTRLRVTSWPEYGRQLAGPATEWRQHPKYALGSRLLHFPYRPAFACYAPDIFGVNRRMTESAQAQEEWQQMQLQAAYITLVSNVVAAAFQEAGLRAQIRQLTVSLRSTARISTL